MLNMEKAFRPKFLDKEIIEKRKEKLKEQYKSLEEGVYLNGKIMEFERQEILRILTMMLPVDFVMMPEEYALIKYPSAFRPQQIMTNLNLNVTMGFSVFPDNVKDKDVKQVAERIKEVLASEEVGLDFGNCRQLANIDAYWFDFRNHGMDQDIYNRLLVTLVKDRLLQITFSCQIQEQLDWKPVVAQMWESIETIKEKRDLK